MAGKMQLLLAVFLLAARLLSSTPLVCTVAVGGSGVISGPTDLLFDDNGALLVVDSGNERVVKWDAPFMPDTAGTVVASGLTTPYDMLLDSSGRLLVSHINEDKVTIGTLGGARTDLITKTVAQGGMAFDQQENLYIIEGYNHRVQKYPKSGANWGSGTIILGNNGAGTNPNQLNRPEGIVADADNNLYINSWWDRGVTKWSPPSYTVGEEIIPASTFNRGAGLRLTDNGMLYAVDSLGAKVFAYNITEGGPAVVVAGQGGQGTQLDQLHMPRNVWPVGEDLYIADQFNDRVLKCSPPIPTSTTTSSTSSATETVSTSSRTTVSTSTTTTRTWTSTTSSTRSSSTSSSVSTTTSSTRSTSSTTSRSSTSSSTSSVTSSSSSSSSSSTSSTHSSTSSSTSTSSSSRSSSTSSSRTSTSSSSSSSSSSTSSSTSSTRTSTSSTGSSSSSSTSSITATTLSSTTTVTSSSSTSSSTLTTSSSSSSSSTTSSTSTCPSGYPMVNGTRIVPNSPPVLLDYVAQEEEALLRQLLARPQLQQVRACVLGARLLAFHLTDALGGSGDVPLGGGGLASVSVPATALQQLNLSEAVALATVFEDEALGDLKPVRPRAAVHLKIFSMGGERIRVAGLAEPLGIRMPVQKSGELACAYWDEATGAFSEEGLASTALDGALLCETTHLSFFAAILRGFLNAFLCAQLDLLSAEGVRLLLSGDWLWKPLALLHWLLLACLAALMLAACVLDARTARSWSDEFWLLPEEEASQEDASPEEESAPAVEPAAAQTSARFDLVLGPLKDGCLDALDEIVSRWFKQFGHVRNLLSNISGGLGDSFSARASFNRRTCLGSMCQGLMSSLAGSLAQSQASATLNISMDMVALVIEEEDVGELLMQAAQDKGGDEEKSRQLRAWQKLHEAVIGEIDRHWERPRSWLRLPYSCLMASVVNNPIACLLTTCHLWSRCQRVLAFSCEVLGTLMLAAVFFESAGGAGPVQDEGNEDCEGDSSLGEQLGQVVAAGLASVILAALPASLLGSLLTRGFRRLPQASRARQLRSWRVQDRLFCGLSLLYIAFCDLFVMLFISNVSSADHDEFGLAAAVGFLEDFVLVPLCLGVVLPVLGLGSLGMTSWLRKKDKLQLLQQSRRERESGEGNWYQVRLAI